MDLCRDVLELLEPATIGKQSYDFVEIPDTEFVTKLALEPEFEYEFQLEPEPETELEPEYELQFEPEAEPEFQLEMEFEKSFVEIGKKKFKPRKFYISKRLKINCSIKQRLMHSLRKSNPGNVIFQKDFKYIVLLCCA